MPSSIRGSAAAIQRKRSRRSCTGTPAGAARTPASQAPNERRIEGRLTTLRLGARVGSVDQHRTPRSAADRSQQVRDRGCRPGVRTGAHRRSAVRECTRRLRVYHLRIGVGFSHVHPNPIAPVLCPRVHTRTLPGTGREGSLRTPSGPHHQRNRQRGRGARIIGPRQPCAALTGREPLAAAELLDDAARARFIPSRRVQTACGLVQHLQRGLIPGDAFVRPLADWRIRADHRERRQHNAPGAGDRTATLLPGRIPVGRIQLRPRAAASLARASISGTDVKLAGKAIASIAGVESETRSAASAHTSAVNSVDRQQPRCEHVSPGPGEITVSSGGTKLLEHAVESCLGEQVPLGERGDHGIRDWTHDGCMQHGSRTSRQLSVRPVIQSSTFAFGLVPPSEISART